MRKRYVMHPGTSDVPAVVLGPDGLPDVLQVRGVHILDSKGNVCTWLDTTAEGAGRLAMFNREGQTSVEVIGEPDGSAHIALCDELGMPVLKLEKDDKGRVGVTINEPVGGLRAFLTLDDLGNLAAAMLGRSGEMGAMTCVNADGHGTGTCNPDRVISSRSAEEKRRKAVRRGFSSGHARGLRR